MKIYKFVLAAGIVLMAAAGCCQKGPKVTAVVAGEENAPVAVVVEYCKAVKADAVTPGTFVLPGTEVAFAFVADQDPTAPKECCKEGKDDCCKEGKPEGKPECCGEKPEKPACCEGKPEGAPEMKPGEKPEGCPAGPACCGKDGKYVVIVLKDAMAAMMPPMFHGAPGMPGKPFPACPDSLKPGEKPACCAEGKPEKPEGAPEMKPGEKPEGAPEMKPGEKPEGMPVPPKGPKGKKFGKRGPKVPVNADITIQQVQDVEYAAGGAAKAWKEAVKVKNFAVMAPCCGPKGPKGPHPHGHPGAPAPKAE